MSPHRTPGEVTPDGPAPLTKGPAKKCRACGQERYVKSGGAYCTSMGALYQPRACSPLKRLGRWWSKCRIAGEHLHERCKVCGAEWLTAFAE